MREGSFKIPILELVTGATGATGATEVLSKTLGRSPTDSSYKTPSNDRIHQDHENRPTKIHFVILFLLVCFLHFSYSFIIFHFCQLFMIYFVLRFCQAWVPKFGPQNLAPGPIFCIVFEFEVNSKGFLHPEAKI